MKTLQDAANEYGESFKTGEWFENLRIEAFKKGAEWQSSQSQEQVKELQDGIEAFRTQNRKLKQDFDELLEKYNFECEQNQLKFNSGETTANGGNQNTFTKSSQVKQEQPIHILTSQEGWQICNGKINQFGHCEKCWQPSQGTSAYCTRLVQPPAVATDNTLPVDLKQKPDELPPIVKFLLGESDFNGLWFGSHDIEANQTKFWWRKHLRELFSTPPTK